MVIKELTNIYLLEENWHKTKLTEEAANIYHERLLVNGNILTYIDKGQLRGYLEFWRLTHEQLARLILNIPIMTDNEDIINGPVAYINNMYIDPQYRSGEAFEMLGAMFLAKNRDAEHFVTFRNLKHHKPIAVYSRAELIRLYTKGI